MRTFGIFVTVFSLFGAGLLCGYVVRGRAVADHADVGSSRPSEQNETHAIAPRNDSRVRGVKEDAVNFGARLSALASTSNPSKRTRALEEIADDLDVSGIVDALADLDTHSVQDASEIRLRLLSRWAELEPGAALQYAERLPHGSEAPHAIAAVIASWAATDTKGAQEGVARMPDTFAKEVARAALVPALSESNPPAAFALLLKARAGYEQLATLFKNWAAKDPAEAAAHALRLPSERQRSVALRDVALKWAEDDREAALSWAQSWRPPTPDGVTIERRDPGPLAAVLQSWVSQDAAAAIQWIEQIPEGFAKTDALAALSRSLSDDDPQHATEVAAMMPPGKAQDTALRNLVGKWAKTDFSGALTWAQQQTDEVRQILLPTLVNDLAWRDTSAALDLALNIDGDARIPAVRNVLSAWIQKEPAAAAAWAAAQSENAQYLPNIAASWAARDQARALEWVNSLPAGPTKDGALAKGVRMIAQSPRPQLATEWIAQMSSEEMRISAYKDLGFWWLRSDPKIARDWILTAPLSAEAKADLLKGSSK